MKSFDLRLGRALMLFEAEDVRGKYENIINMYRSGVRIREIAAANGESVETIENILSKLNRRDEARRVRRNDIIRMFSDGYSARDVADRYGISVDKVYDISRSSEGDSLEDDSFGRILPGAVGAPRKFNRDEIVNLYNSGVSVSEIASRLGASVPTIYNVVRDARDSGANLAPRKRKADKRAIVDLYNSGVGVSEIASRLGVSVSTVYNVMRDVRDSGGVFEGRLAWALGSVLS